MNIKTECDSCSVETTLHDTGEVETTDYGSRCWGDWFSRPVEAGEWIKWDCPNCDDAQAYFLSQD